MVLTTLGLIAACSGDDGPVGAAGSAGPEGPAGPAAIENFTSALAGTNEVPANTSTAAGTATISVVGPILVYRIDVTGIPDVTGAHIHGPAAAGTNTGIFVNLCGRGSAPACATGTVNGVLVSGTATPESNISVDSMLVLFRNENSYVNVHTTGIPGGEIRGQVMTVAMQ